MPNYTIAADPNHDVATSYNGRNLAIDVAGILWSVYTRRVGGLGRIYAAYSNDGGATWTEEDVSVDAFPHQTPTIAIDSMGIIHVTYTTTGRAPFVASYGVFYRQRSVLGVWSAEETVSLQNTGGAIVPTSSIAIDSVDDIHCVISTKGYGVNVGIWNIIYRARVAGAWGAVVQITDLAVNQGLSAIAIDSLDVVHLTWVGLGWGGNPANSLIVYCASPLWVAEVVDDGAYNDMIGSIAVDSLDNPYIAWIDRSVDMAYYSVRIAGAWSARERIDAADDVGSLNVGIAIDKNDDLHFVYSGWPFVPPGLPLNILYRRRVGGVWLDQVNITIEADDQLYPVILWATWPQIGGVRTNVPLARQYFIWKSIGVAVMFGDTGISIPILTTDPATAISHVSATLNGILTDDGGEACNCGFEWGETVAYGNTTPTQSRTTGQTFSQPIGGLSPGTTYHFRAFATNGAGTGYGADRTFTPQELLSINRAYALAREEL